MSCRATADRTGIIEGAGCQERRMWTSGGLYRGRRHRTDCLSENKKYSNVHCSQLGDSEFLCETNTYFLSLTLSQLQWARAIKWCGEQYGLLLMCYSAILPPVDGRTWTGRERGRDYTILYVWHYINSTLYHRATRYSHRCWTSHRLRISLSASFQRSW